MVVESTHTGSDCLVGFVASFTQVQTLNVSILALRHSNLTVESRLDLLGLCEVLSLNREEVL